MTPRTILSMLAAAALVLVTSNCAATDAAKPPASEPCTGERDDELCARLGKTCGALSATDACGVARSIASCGACNSPETCGADGVCQCVSESDSDLCLKAAANCGTVSVEDRCGRAVSVECGSCPERQEYDATHHCVETRCGNAEVAARYEACVSATGQAECEAAQGNWKQQGPGPFRCFCPTGQAACKCTAASDCLGDCYAQLNEYGNCALVEGGYCAPESPLLGCWCRHQTGEWIRVCAD